MTPKRARIQSEKEIDTIFKKGKRYNHSVLSVWVYKRSPGPFRSVVICSRKVDKRATRRNLLKRRVRELLRGELRKKLYGKDVIVSLKPASNTKSSKEFKEIFNYVLNF